MSVQTQGGRMGGGDGIGGDFDAAAGEMPESENDLNGTAQKQIDLQEEHEAEIRNHKQRLIAMQHNFAAGNVNIPRYDLGPNAGRNLKQDYEMLYTKWQNQGVAINLDYSDQREAIRENGVTLVSEFERGGMFEVKVQEVPPALSQDFQSASKDNAPALESARDQKSNLEDHAAALRAHDKALDDITRDADIAQASAPNDHEALAALENRTSEWEQEFDEINNTHEHKGADIGEGKAPHEDEVDNAAWYEIVPQNFEYDLPQDMKAAFNEGADNDYWLDQDFEDGLDFDVSPNTSHENGHGHDGGHER